jgi:hypothetical protein
MERHPFHGPGSFRPSHGSRAAHVIGWVFLGVAFAVVFALVFGIVVKLLWNWLMPAIFGLGEISYWQAFGLVILAKLLFGALGHRHRDHSNHFHKKFSGWKEDYHGEKKEDDMIEGWKHYKQYWQEEGKAAFEDYLQRMKQQKESKSEG